MSGELRISSSAFMSSSDRMSETNAADSIPGIPRAVSDEIEAGVPHAMASWTTSGNPSPTEARPAGRPPDNTARVRRVPIGPGRLHIRADPTRRVLRPPADEDPSHPGNRPARLSSGGQALLLDEAPDEEHDGPVAGQPSSGARTARSSTGGGRKSRSRRRWGGTRDSRRNGTNRGEVLPDLMADEDAARTSTEHEGGHDPVRPARRAADAAPRIGTMPICWVTTTGFPDHRATRGRRPRFPGTGCHEGGGGGNAGLLLGVRSQPNGPQRG